MKRELLLPFLMVIVCSASAQENNTQNAVVLKKLDTGNRAAPQQNSPSSSSTNASTVTLDQQIAALDAKIVYYESHPEEKAVALNDGTIAKLQEERNQLILKRKALNPPTQTLSATGNKTTPSTPNTSLATVEHCDVVIASIDSKVASVKADPAQHEQALSSGYYEMMAKQRAKLVEQREQLLLQKQNEQK